MDGMGFDKQLYYTPYIEKKTPSINVAPQGFPQWFNPSTHGEHGKNRHDVRWLGRQELRDVARRKHLGLNFAREVRQSKKEKMEEKVRSKPWFKVWVI